MQARPTFRTALVAMLVAAGAAGLVVAASRAAPMNATESILPNGWIIRAPLGVVTQTDTMPQGASLSPDGRVVAVVTSGFNPAALQMYDAKTLHEIRNIPLAGAFGRPRWYGAHVIVAGANADAIFDIDSKSGSMRKIGFPAKSYPVALAISGDRIAVATDGDGAVRIGTLSTVGSARSIPIGEHPGGVAFSAGGKNVFVAVRSADYVQAITAATGAVRRIKTGLHPADVLVHAGELYVAQSDDDSIGIYNAASGGLVTNVYLGNGSPGGTIGASPNALAAYGDDVFVSLGAANEIAVIHGHRNLARIPAGWYPTDVVASRGMLYIVNGKGEGTRPNPGFDAKSTSFHDYIAAIQFGSLRAVAFPSAASTNPQGAAGWNTDSSNTIVRKNGPIKHVFFILKENRSYDQVLGDMPQGNGDAKLVWFGKNVTPNQHALATQFGLFDNMYASGEVSDSGHNWADGAFANDYVERYWPPAYGGRRDTDDVLVGYGAGVAHNGYMWDAAQRAHVSFRDYGEMATSTHNAVPPEVTAPSLRGRYDPRYVGWNLDYSDVDRVKEWRREFDTFVRNGTLPQLEYIWLPNDHTFGSHAGKLTPVAYVATNDYAVGQIVQTISHSKVWASSAIFITEDDAQDGADHVSDQRTVLYIASPYAKGGVNHDHFSTVSVLRTIEVLLGMKPLSTYDAKAVPLYSAFSSTAVQGPFAALAARVDTHARNSKVAYGSRISARADFSRPDAVPAGVLLNILAHNHGATPRR